ncbi:hypothetical protein ACFL2X_00420 [Candidatus Latescibacterota bacterium]
MSIEKKKSSDFYSFGIILSVLFIILSIIWVVVSNLYNDDNSDDLTWVG